MAVMQGSIHGYATVFQGAHKRDERSETMTTRSRTLLAILTVVGHIAVAGLFISLKGSEPPQTPVMVGILPQPMKPQPVAQPNKPQPVVKRSTPARSKPAPAQQPVAKPEPVKKQQPVEEVRDVEETPEETESEPASNQSGEATSTVQPIYRAAYLNNRQPPYPIMSRRLREQGIVRLRVLVNAKGRADTVNVLGSSGHVRLDLAAKQAVSSWTFVPAKKGARNIAAWVEVPIRFTLER